MSSGVDQFVEKYGFVAVGAGSTATEAAGEAVAVFAPLFSDEALPAVGTFVDRLVAGSTRRWELR
jgi:hypothetical protein